MNITTLGIDLAKNIFGIVGMNQHGKVVCGKTLSRKNYYPSLINAYLF